MYQCAPCCPLQNNQNIPCVVVNDCTHDGVSYSLLTLTGEHYSRYFGKGSATAFFDVVIVDQEQQLYNQTAELSMTLIANFLLIYLFIFFFFLLHRIKKWISCRRAKISLLKLNFMGVSSCKVDFFSLPVHYLSEVSKKQISLLRMNFMLLFIPQHCLFFLRCQFTHYLAKYASNV